MDRASSAAFDNEYQIGSMLPGSGNPSTSTRACERLSQKSANGLRLRGLGFRLSRNPTLELCIEVGIQTQADVWTNAGLRPSSTSFFFVTDY